MEESGTTTKIDLRYAEHSIQFDIIDCSTDKKYSFHSLNREEAEKLIKRLRYIGKMTWKQLVALPRKNGLTPEKQQSPNFDLIHKQNSSEERITEQYYFHFRVEQNGLFRVFGYQRKNLFCITHIDPKGKINH